MNPPKRSGFGLWIPGTRASAHIDPNDRSDRAEITIKFWYRRAGIWRSKAIISMNMRKVRIKLMYFFLWRNCKQIIGIGKAMTLPMTLRVWVSLPCHKLIQKLSGVQAAIEAHKIPRPLCSAMCWFSSSSSDRVVCFFTVYFGVITRGNYFSCETR